MSQKQRTTELGSLSVEPVVEPPLSSDIPADSRFQERPSPNGAPVLEQAPSLKSLVVRGSLWTVSGHAVGQAIRLGSNLILTRLLFPEAFGLMALVQVLKSGLVMFSDLGIGLSVIQNQRGEDPEFYNTAWTIQILRGMLLWLGTCLLAWPAVVFFDAPMLAQLLPVAGISAVIAGFNSTKLFAAARHLKLGRLTCIDLSTQIISIVCIVVLAWNFRSVWAIVFGNFVGGVVKLVLSHWTLPGVNNRVCWSHKALRELFGFGRWVFLSSVLTFVAMQGDRLILGRFFDLATLGVYSIAVLIVRSLGTLFVRVSNRAVFPAMSKIARNNPDNLRRVYHKVRLIQDIPLGALAAILFCSGPFIIDFLYDARYAPAGWMLQVLSLHLLFDYSQSVSQQLLMAIGRPAYCTAANAARVVALLTIVPAAFFLYGIYGGVTAIALQPACGIPFLLYGLGKHRLLSMRFELIGVLSFAGVYVILTAVGL